MTLHVEGLVSDPTEFDDRRLAGLQSVIDDVASITPRAVGRAVRVSDVIDAASPRREATHVTAIAADGSYRASIPIDALQRGGWLAFGLDDRTLPVSEGGPLRLTVADGTTLCWNVKNVGVLRLTAGPEPDDVPENPPH